MTEKVNPQLEQNQHENPMSLMGRVLSIGFFGGVFWSFIGYVGYLLNFTEIPPSLVLNPWAFGDWKHSTIGQFIGIFAIGILSVLAALIYYGLFRKTQHLWIGLLYGAGLWLFVFYLLNPIFPGLKHVTQLDTNSLVTTICLYILYGIFVGYSISFEFSEMDGRQANYSND